MMRIEDLEVGDCVIAHDRWMMIEEVWVEGEVGFQSIHFMAIDKNGKEQELNFDSIDHIYERI